MWRYALARKTTYGLLGDIRMVHERQRLPLRFEAGDHLAGERLRKAFGTGRG